MVAHNPLSPTPTEFLSGHLFGTVDGSVERFVERSRDLCLSLEISCYRIGDVDFDSIDTNDTSTMWKPSRLELICCTISAFAISKKLPETDQESAKNVKSFLGLIREEFKTLRDYWRCLTNRVAGHDELRMATERFRLFDDGTDSHLRTDELSANVLRPHMVMYILDCIKLLGPFE